jgi:hypothetical protein
MNRKLPGFVVAHFLVSIIVASCAAPAKTPGDYRIQTGPPTVDARITDAKAWTETYGLLVRGAVGIRPDITAAGIHSVDVDVMGPDGKEIRKFTTQYHPLPRLNRPKAQIAHFILVMANAPPAGSVIKVTLTPEPVNDHGLPPM